MRSHVLQSKVLNLYKKGIGILINPIIGDFDEHLDELLTEYDKPNHGNIYTRIIYILMRSNMTGPQYYSILNDNISQIERILTRNNYNQESKR